MIGKLTPNDLTRLYHGLEIEDEDIDKAKGSNRADVEEKARRVLTFVKKAYPVKYTLENILAGLEEAKKIDHMQQLDKKWKPGPEGAWLYYFNKTNKFQLSFLIFIFFKNICSLNLLDKDKKKFSKYITCCKSIVSLHLSKF